MGCFIRVDNLIFDLFVGYIGMIHAAFAIVYSTFEKVYAAFGMINLQPLQWSVQSNAFFTTSVVLG